MSKFGPLIISIIVVLGFVLILVLLVLRPITIEEHIVDVLKILVGTLAAKFGDVVQYHIGSSLGSKDKDAVLGTMAARLTPQTPPKLEETKHD